MTIDSPVALEIARFLVGRPTPEQIVAYHPSPEATDQFYALITSERDGTITDDERADLESCISLEYMMRMVKAEAEWMRKFEEVRKAGQFSPGLQG